MKTSHSPIGGLSAVDTRHPTVLVLLARGDFASCMLTGIQAHAHEAGWRLQTIEYVRRRASRYSLSRSPAGESVADLIDFWHPSGVIVHSLHPPVGFRQDDFPGRPVVFLDRTPDTLPEGTACVYCDPESVTRAAALELMQPGFDDFAFVPWFHDQAWSRWRGDAFARLVAMNGKRLHVFRHPAGAAAERNLADHLAPWVASLPKPCGVFAVNDQIAEGVLAACLMAGIAVPDELAVVGIDDNVGVCENTKPTLSSVRLDFEGSGRAAGALLGKLMAGRTPSTAVRLFGALGLTRRESSLSLSVPDAAVRKALEFIRLHACEGIGPRDVVRAMGISRTQADLRFRAAVRHTLLDEVHLVRLARAKELVARGVAPAAIADMCGYSSLADLQRVFRRRVGKTMRAWAKESV